MELKESKIGRYIVEFRDLLGDNINSPSMKKFPKKIKNELISYNGFNESIGLDLGEFILTYFASTDKVLEITEGLDNKSKNRLVKVFETIQKLVTINFSGEPQ